MTFNKNIAILIVAFLGKPKTIQSKLKDSDIRYLHTKNAFLKIRKYVGNENLFIGLVGDQNDCSRFIEECGLNDESAKWFEQDEGLINRGTGALENQLILKCINYWSLQKNYDYIVKITGKYQVFNLNEVLKLAGEINQPIYAWKIYFQNMVDTRVLIFNANFYVKNQSFLARIDSPPGLWMENIVYEIIRNYCFDFGMVFARPILKGLAGTTNEFSLTPLHKRILINTITKFVIFKKNIPKKIKFIINKLKL